MSTRTIAALLAGAGLVLTAAGCTGGSAAPTTAAAASASSAAGASAPSGSSGGSGNSDTGATAQAPEVGLAANGAYPFQVALLDLTATDDNGKLATDNVTRFSCGGSLLDERHVLTAGHCFMFDSAEAPEPTKDFQVVIGRTTLTSTEGQVRRITDVEVHPEYSERPLRYDVAVLTLDKPVTGITPVTLVTPGVGTMPKAGSLVAFTGWGSPKPKREGDEGETPTTDQMKKATVPLLADSECSATYAKNKRQLNGLKLPDMEVSLCTSTADEIGHCLGDSGSPLFTTDGQTIVQLGIVSFSPGCGDPRFPSVYARLDNSDINDFVRRVTGKLG